MKVKYKPKINCYNCDKPLKYKGEVPDTYFCDDSCRNAYWKEAEERRKQKKLNNFR